MTFNSLTYIIFFIVASGCFFVARQQWRWIVLLVASYVFYGVWDHRYVSLLAFVTVTSWSGGIWLADEARSQASRKAILVAAIGLIGAILGVFKYHVLIAQTANVFADVLSSEMHFNPIEVLLPVGISFYSFQAVAYLVDVYREPSAKEPSLGYYALYISFFPQLVAGPIERARNILPQIKGKLDFEYGNICEGLALVLWGFFKKLVIADRVAVYVNHAFTTPDAMSPYQLLIAAYFFSFQIYCDFSGYTDIARGSAKVFGINLMENFRQPYFASSFVDFWRRWHISLSTWFRDYLYIPLGGNRVSMQRWMFNMMVVFSLCGLWHGASWNFVVWGMIHGLFLCCNRLVQSAASRMGVAAQSGRALALLKIFVVFHATTFAWIFFRIKDFGDALSILQKIFSSALLTGFQTGGPPLASMKQLFVGALLGDTFSGHELSISIVSILILVLGDYLARKDRYEIWHARLGTLFRWSVNHVLFFVILIFGFFGISEFIYFQF